MQYTVGSQCKCDSHYWSVYAHCHSSGCHRLLGRNMWVEVSSNLLLSSKFIFFNVQFLYSRLNWAICTIPKFCSGWLGKTFAIFWLTQGKTFTQPAEPPSWYSHLSNTKATLCSPLYWGKFGFLCNSYGQSLPRFFPEIQKHRVLVRVLWAFFSFRGLLIGHMMHETLKCKLEEQCPDLHTKYTSSSRRFSGDCECLLGRMKECLLNSRSSSTYGVPKISSSVLENNNWAWSSF